MGVGCQPLGGPGDEVVARAPNGTDVSRDLLLEDEHVARDAALGRRLPHDGRGPEARLRPGRPQVIDHHRDRVPCRSLRRHENAIERGGHERRRRARRRAKAGRTGGHQRRGCGACGAPFWAFDPRATPSVARGAGVAAPTAVIPAPSYGRAWGGVLSSITTATAPAAATATRAMPRPSAKRRFISAQDTDPALCCKKARVPDRVPGIQAPRWADRHP